MLSVLRTSILLLVLATIGTVQAQAVRRKHLVMSVGGGIGVMNVYSDRRDIAVEGLGSGAFRAAFGYAVADRWSLGIHYDRIGSAWHNGGLDRLHMTTYLLSVAYRPWVSERSALEFEFAFGAAASSLFPNDTRLPYTAAGGAAEFGLRYLGMMSGTIGAFIALEHATSSSDELVLEGGLVNADGTKSRVQWNAQRLTAGMIVRF